MRSFFKYLCICSRWVIGIHRMWWTIKNLNRLMNLFMRRFMRGFMKCLRRGNVRLTSVWNRDDWWLFNRSLNWNWWNINRS